MTTDELTQLDLDVLSFLSPGYPVSAGEIGADLGRDAKEVRRAIGRLRLHLKRAGLMDPVGYVRPETRKQHGKYTISTEGLEWAWRHCT